MSMVQATTEETVNGTATEFAARWGTTYAIANNILNFLKDKDVAKKTGEKPNPTGKGKGASIYTVPAVITMRLNCNGAVI